MISKEDADEKVSQGYLRAWIMFEVLAVNEKTTKDSLETLINKLEKDPRVKMYKKEFSKIVKVEKPTKKIDSAYSQNSEIELITKNFDNLVQIVIEYGPSTIELLDPKRMEISCGEAQAVLNTISQMMHRFAAAGYGGIVFIREGEQ